MKVNLKAMATNPFPFPLPDGTYIVGGAVRDMLLGRPPQDWDLATRHDPCALARELARELNVHPVSLGKPDQPLVRLIAPGITIDLTPLEGESLEKDLRRRDFTINAMAWDPRQNQLMDPFQGLRDLKARTIRRVTSEGFHRDPLRLLRAYRFAAQLQYEIDTATMDQIHREASQINRSAGERIRDELLKLLAVPHSHPYIAAMAATGLLFHILPELTPTQGCGQGWYHDMDVWNHTLAAFQHLETMLLGLSRLTTGIEQTEILPFDHGQGLKTDRPLLKLTCLLHDIGKPAAHTTSKDGSVHFYGHARKGGEMAENIGRRLKLSKAQSQFFTHIIRRHLDPLQLYHAHRQGTLTNRGIIRFFNRNHPRVAELLLHALADHQGKRTANPPDQSEFKQFTISMLNRYHDHYRVQRAHTPLLTGQDLIKELHLHPGPLFKTILDRVEEARLAGELECRNEALALAKTLARRQPRIAGENRD